MTNQLVDSSRLFKPALRPFYRPFQPALEAALGLNGINRLYDACRGRDADEFPGTVMRQLGLSWDFPDAEVERLKSIQGPLMVVANHPMGGPEAMLMMLLLKRLREDYRILANYVLGSIPEIKSRLILVDPFGGDQSTSRNLGPMRSALDWLKSGRALGLFPAGEVSSWQPGRDGVWDREWQAQAGKLALKSKATVLPLYFEGEQGPAFHAAGLVSPWLRTLMLPRTLLKPPSQHLKFRFGQPISSDKISELGDAGKVSRYLRERCYLLASSKKPPEVPAAVFESVAEAVPSEKLQEEIRSLARQGRGLSVQDSLETFYFWSHEAPALMSEIGRMREVSFRKAGEGTGKARDLDDYDPQYIQLLLWDHQAGCVAGGYRMADAAAILRQSGPKGLYCHSLFEFKEPMFEELEDALELGRSFVSPEYQKGYLPLFLLWRGIGAWLAKNPRFKYLFGCVSISPDFSPLTQQLLVGFIRQSNFDRIRSAWVRPRWAFKVQRHFETLVLRALELQSMNQVQELVDEIEQGRLKLPILLKHYLKLGGRILAFNVDPKFNRTLDGLFMVDLRKSNPQLLQKYMGPQEARTYLDYHAPGR